MAATTAHLLAVPQVAELLGVSESWVRIRTKAGDIPHVRLGGNIRYRITDIEDYVSSNMSVKAEGSDNA